MIKKAAEFFRDSASLITKLQDDLNELVEYMKDESISAQDRVDAYACVQKSEQMLNEVRKKISRELEEVKKLIAYFIIMANLDTGVKHCSVKTPYFTLTYIPQKSIRTPNRKTDPEGFQELGEFLGIPKEVVHVVDDFKFEEIKKKVCETLERGENLPERFNDIDKMYDYVELRVRKGKSSPLEFLERNE